MEKQKKIECEFCGKKFVPKTSRARFCSDVCRVYANRAARAEAAIQKSTKKHGKPATSAKVSNPKKKEEKPLPKKDAKRMYKALTGEDVPEIKKKKATKVVEVVVPKKKRTRPTIHEISLAEYGFKPEANDGFVFPDDLGKIQPDERPSPWKEMKTFNDFLNAAKLGVLGDGYEQHHAYLKLNANQRSMIQAKIKQS